ncbi:MAG: hypothetical protein AMXMBFR83_05490 [Phycisphaerae bacterium]
MVSGVETGRILVSPGRSLKSGSIGATPCLTERRVEYGLASGMPGRGTAWPDGKRGPGRTRRADTHGDPAPAAFRFGPDLLSSAGDIRGVEEASGTVPRQ